MVPEDDNNLLEGIKTDYAALEALRQGGALARAAQEALMARYSAAVRRYLGGALRDEHAADEVFQEFCLRMVRGDFHNVDPERGRFRQFLKTVLFRLVVDYQRRKKTQPSQWSAEAPEPAAAPAPDEGEERFLMAWREELLDRTWRLLAQVQPRGELSYHDLLRHRADFQDQPSQGIAQTFTLRLGRPVSADAVRQTLKRARDKFADLLVAEVARTLDNPTPEALEEELRDLGFLSYCAGALERRNRGY